MKFSLSASLDSWNGIRSLPAEIAVRSPTRMGAEFELLQVICGLHGYITAFDLLTGSEGGSEKDQDMECILQAFQAYLRPSMPLSHYSGSEKRLKIYPSDGVDVAKKLT
jgi:hypothetical protein